MEETISSSSSSSSKGKGTTPLLVTTDVSPPPQHSLRRVGSTSHGDSSSPVFKITIIGPDDGSEVELVNTFISNGEAQQAASLSVQTASSAQQQEKTDKEGSADGQELDIFLPSWKKKFNFAGNEYLLELQTSSQTQAETALDKSANAHVHDQFQASSGFMFLYDVTRRATFAEVMRVHGLILRLKNMEKGKAKNLIPMIVLGNTSRCGINNQSPKPSSRSNSMDGGSPALAASASNAADGAREVSTEEGLEFAYSCNCPFYEISSSNYADALNAFQQLLGEVIKDQRKRALTETKGSGTKGAWRKSLVAPTPDENSNTIVRENPNATDKDSLKTSKESEVKEELHESLKGRQKAFRYTRVDTEEIKYLPPLDDEPNSKPRIRAATLPKLIEKLTYPKYPDTDLVATFLLTYRSFTTPDELLFCLTMRYEITPPSNLDKEGYRLWEANELLPIRLRVINVLKSWITDHFYDFYDNKTLLDNLKEFVDKQLKTPNNLKGPLQQLRKSIETCEMERRARKEYMFSSKPPKSVVSKKVAKARPQEIDMRDLDPLEMARQLTLIDYDLLTRIQPKEWLDHNSWANKKQDGELNPKCAAPNLVAMINHFNHVSKWVATEIVKCAKIKQRILLTKMFIEVAQHCLKLNNFNMLMAIVTGGLGNVSVYRLKYSWKSLPKKSLMAYDELKTLCDSLSNFGKLRAAIKAAVPPTIPYLGLYLSDLMYIEDGNADLIEGGLINFEKRRLKAEIIKDLQNYQAAPYCLTEVPVLQYFFRGLEYESDAELYRMSCLLEPHARQRESSTANAPAKGLDQLTMSTSVSLYDSTDWDLSARQDTEAQKELKEVESGSNILGVVGGSLSGSIIAAHKGEHDKHAEEEGNSPKEDPRTSKVASTSALRIPSPRGNGPSPLASASSGVENGSFMSPMRSPKNESNEKEQRAPRVGAILRAKAKALEGIARSFSFATAARATAVIEVLNRWEAQIAARRVYIVTDHSNSNEMDATIDVSSTPSKESSSTIREKRSGSIKKREKENKKREIQQLQQQHERTFSFEEVIMESKAVEVTIQRFLQTASVEGVLEATHLEPSCNWLLALETFLQRRLLGGQHAGYISELMFALIKLLDKGQGSFDAPVVASVIGMYKKQPVRLATHFVIDEADGELENRQERLIELEEREGVRTIQSYSKEVRLTMQILNLEKRILQAIKMAQPDGTMLYSVLCFDRDGIWKRTQEAILNYASTHAAEKSDGAKKESVINDFIQLVDVQLREVAREDKLKYNESYADALEEYFEWMGIYLRKLYDKLVIIHKRMEKLVRMKEASKESHETVSRAVKVWRDKDMVHLQALIGAVDQAETTVNRFLQSCPTSSTDGLEVTQEEGKALLAQNHVFEQIIKMRQLQKLLEEQNSRILGNV